MHNRIRIIVPLLIVVAIGGGAFWWWNSRSTTVSAASGLSGSGTIEAEQVLITAEVAGRVQELAVDEGQEVAAGATLAMLDSVLLQGQRTQANAALQVTEANLALLKAGSREEEVVVAQAQVAQAQAGRDGAAAALSHAQEAENLSNGQAQTAQSRSARAAVDAAQAQLAAAEAQVTAAQARLAITKSGARPEQLAVAEAQRQQAQVARDQVDLQLAKTTLTAPRAGLILSRILHEGEQAAPGSAIMTIGALDTVQLTIYIAESAIGQVTQGQAAEVTVNSFPGRVFNGQVTHIADQAQFTPRSVQTREERATTVFAVRIDISNSDHALKPGMPADAMLVR